ncbi:hypothetical protein BH10ACI1_BH10ACI1_26160 [soil metagenome]
MLKENSFKGRKCSICSHEKVKQMNSLINRGQLSFRAISRHFCGNDSMRDALRRHTENCLKLELGALIKDNRIEQAIDYRKERAEAMHRVKKMVEACEDWMTDPADAQKFTLAPRADDLQVVYDDWNVMFQGKPTRKKTMLSELLEDLHRDHNIQAVKIINTQMDNRKVFLEALKNLDTKLDAIAKTEGLYQQDRQNEVDIIRQAERVLKILSEGGEYAQQYFLKMCESGDFTPEVKAEVERRLGERTVSDAVN